MQMPKKSGERDADVHRRFFQTWKSYARWGESLERGAAEQLALADREAAHEAIERIVKAFRALIKAEETHLAELLRTSDQRLAPFFGSTSATLLEPSLARSAARA